MNSPSVLYAAEWTVVIDELQVASLAALWNVPGIQLCAVDARIWVQGSALSETDAPLVGSLPAEERYEMRGDQRLFRAGECLPVATLPEGDWVSLREFFNVSLPATLLPAASPKSLPMRLVRSPHSMPSNVVATSFAQWYAFAINAPQIRLRQLSFAVRNSGTTVVRGCPVPTLSGRHFVEEDGVALPAGLIWQPAMRPRAVAERCKLQKGDLALFSADAMWTRIPAAEFVPASRSAARATRDGLSSKEGRP